MEVRRLRRQRRENETVKLLRLLVREYVGYLRRKGWVEDWLRWGGHSVNLYDLWRSSEELRRVFPRLEDLVEFLRRLERERDYDRELARLTYGISYTHYFIYDEPERKYSLQVLVDAARRVLGSELDRLLAG